jgi:hypothetical protein
MAGRTTRVFTSWSGPRSREIALALKSLLEDIFEEGVVVFISDHISPGELWIQRLGKELEQSEFGLLCLTQDNYESPWLLFEAGALGKKFGTSRVVPYLIDELPADSQKSPLHQFQNVRADKQGTFQLVETINAKRENPKPSDRLERSFNRWWRDLEDTLKRVWIGNRDLAVKQSDRELLETISKRVEVLWRAHESKSSSIDLFPSPNEVIHLRNLRDQPSTTYSRHSDLQMELRHLRDLGLIKNNKPIADLPGSFRLDQFFNLTDKGIKYLEDRPAM